MKFALSRLLGLIIVACSFAAGAPAHAQNYPIPRFYYAMSPDHPKTWVDGAMRTHQDLCWNADKHLLEADVTYSTADYADNTRPPQEDDFILAFPSVKFDAATKKLTAKGKTIGTLEDGFFGHHIALAHDVQLSIHRHHGVVYGALVPNNTEND